MSEPYVKLEIKGMPRLLRKMNATTSTVAIIKGFKRAGIHISGWIKENRLTGPRPKYLGVKSGRLRASIISGNVYKMGNKFSMPIGTNVKYGKFHELGTKRLPKRPFLQPGIENRGNQREAVRLILESIKSAQMRA